jgi:nanoRNase/pAp phosphatase (c-di-AMP/oligoRNAs hydrolase)
MFNGGGHKNACGLILKSETEFTNVISELEKISL